MVGTTFLYHLAILTLPCTARSARPLHQPKFSMDIPAVREGGNDFGHPLVKLSVILLGRKVRFLSLYINRKRQNGAKPRALKEAKARQILVFSTGPDPVHPLHYGI